MLSLSLYKCPDQEILKAGLPSHFLWDTGGEELVGNYSNGGQEWQPQGEPGENPAS